MYIFPSIWVLCTPNPGRNLLFCVFHVFVLDFDSKIMEKEEKIIVFWVYSLMLVDLIMLIM